jgi:hypothetical protein
LKGLNASLVARMKPYLFISLTGMFAFAPVSFMLRALKNDIIAIEYPIKYFISESIHNGEIPLWFNTWAMGFPLQSNLTWGIFSTPQLVFSSLFRYNITVLHLEFMFYVLLAGWSMYYLLRKHFKVEERMALVLSCCYMLSGFVTASSQWLLYITAASFAPWLLHALLSFIKAPSLRYALMFAVIYYLMFTSVYPAFSIITSYCILVFVLYRIISSVKNRVYFRKLLLYSGTALLLTMIFCIPCLYFTLEVLSQIERGSAIAEKTSFFNTNYLHPAGLPSLLLPLSAVKISIPGTEGTMMNSYMGWFMVLTMPIALVYSIRHRNTAALLLAGVAVFFLLVSSGNLLPFRSWLNVLPGFSYFRNPGLFRFYFILFIILAVAVYLQNKKTEEVFQMQSPGTGRLLKWTTIVLFVVLLNAILIHARQAGDLFSRSLPDMIKSISFSQTVFINSVLQLILLTALYFFIRKEKYRLARNVFLLDLIANTLLCTPFFTVSSYTPEEVHKIFSPVNGFPVQVRAPSDVPAVFTDGKNNTWYNVNVFKKEISSAASYFGPLYFEKYSERQQDSSLHFLVKEKPLLFFAHVLPDENNFIEIIRLTPATITAFVKTDGGQQIILQQNYFPGWQAYYTGRRIPVSENDYSLISVSLPKGEGVLEFRFEKRKAVLAAALNHLVVIVVLISALIGLIRKKFYNTAG